MAPIKLFRISFLAAFLFLPTLLHAEPWHKLNVTCGVAPSGPPAFSPGTTFNDISIPSPATIYAVGYNFNERGLVGEGVLCKSTDSGENWTAASLPIPAGLSEVPSLYGIDCSSDFKCYAVGEGCHIFKTVNGADWSFAPAFSRPASCSSNLIDVEIVPGTSGNTAVAVGWLGRVLRTTTGSFWSYPALPAGVGTPNFESVHFSNGTNGWIVGGANTIIKSITAGASWTSVLAPADLTNNLSNVFGLDSHVWINGDMDLVRSDDNGGIWNPHAYIAPGVELGGSVWGNLPFTDSHFVDADTGFAVGLDLLKSIDGGDTWVDDEDTSVLDAGGNAINPSSLNGVEFYNAHLGFIVGDDQTILRRASPPDLRVLGGWSLACAGNYLHIIAQIQNNGWRPVNAAMLPFQVRVESLDGGSLIHSEIYDIVGWNNTAEAPIPPGWGTTVPIPFSGAELYSLFNPSGLGRLTFRITADINDNVPESDEGNNVGEMACDFPVAVAPGPDPDAGGTAPAPSPSGEKDKKKKSEKKKQSKWKK